MRCWQLSIHDSATLAAIDSLHICQGSTLEYHVDGFTISSRIKKSTSLFNDLVHRKLLDRLYPLPRWSVGKLVNVQVYVTTEPTHRLLDDCHRLFLKVRMGGATHTKEWT